MAAPASRTPVATVNGRIGLAQTVMGVPAGRIGKFYAGIARELRTSPGYRRSDKLRPLMKTTAIVLALAFGAGSSSSLAHDYQKASLTIDHPWARATVAGQTVAAGYLTIRNKGAGADRLVGAESAAAQRVEMHVTTIDRDVARMREVKSFELLPGATLRLAPGGNHLMLLGLKRPLKTGERIPVTLRFERAGELGVEFAVEATSRGAAAAHKH